MREQPDWQPIQGEGVETYSLFPESELGEALKYIKAKRKRRLGPEDVARLTERLLKFRKGAAQEGRKPAQNRLAGFQR